MASPDASGSSTPTPEQIQAQLDSEDFGNRISGINNLRTLDPSAALRMIEPLCADSNTRVRYAAVSQLSSLGAQDRAKALSLLKTALSDDEPDVQAAAADSLGALKLTDAYEDVAALYEATPEWLVKMSIVACLGEMGDRRAFELLSGAIQSDNSLVAVSAMGALGELEDERAIALLLPYVQDEDWQVRHRIAEALAHYPDSSEAKAALSALAKDDSPIVAEVAQRVISQ